MSRLTLIAVSVDVLAVVLLGVAALLASLDAFFSAVLAVFLLSAVTAAAGAIVSASALLRGRHGVVFAIRLTGVILAFVAVVPVSVVVIASAYGLRSNPAQQAAQSLEQVLSEAGGRRLCSFGDSGRPGPNDNRKPVYGAVWELPADDGQVHQRLVTVAEAHNIALGLGALYDHGRSPAVNLVSGQRSVENPCGHNTLTASRGDQLVSLRLEYSYSYWFDRHE